MIPYRNWLMLQLLVAGTVLHKYNIAVHSFRFRLNFLIGVELKLIIFQSQI